MSTMGSLIGQGANQVMEREAQMMPYMNMMYKDQLKGTSNSLAAYWMTGKFNERQHEKNSWSVRGRSSSGRNRSISGRSVESSRRIRESSRRSRELSRSDRKETRSQLYNGGSPSTSRTRLNTEEDADDELRFHYTSGADGEGKA